MSKNVYMLVWQTESSDRGVDGSTTARLAST